jgi:hypothetical protein
MDEEKTIRRLTQIHADFPERNAGGALRTQRNGESKQGTSNRERSAGVSRKAVCAREMPPAALFLQC